MPRSFLPSVLLLASLAACGGGGKARGAERQPLAPRKVRLVEAVLGQVERTVAVHGTLVAEEEVDVAFKTPGRLLAIHKDLGDPVTKDEPVAQLDTIEYELRVRQAEAAVQQARVRLGLDPTGTEDRVDLDLVANVREAKAVLEEARLNKGRAAELVRGDLAAQSQLDATIAAAAVAESRLQEAREEARNRAAVLVQRRAELAIARQQLNECTLRAPFAGEVAMRHASPGRYLATGDPVATLVRVDPLRLRMLVPERAAAALKRGQQVEFKIETDPRPFTGTVVRTSPRLDVTNRTLTVEAEVKNDGALRPGGFARVLLVLAAGDPVVLVPQGSVVTFAGVQKVFVERDGKAAEVRVRTGVTQGDLVEVLDLQAGARVVVAPGDLVAGQPLVVEK